MRNYPGDLALQTSPRPNTQSWAVERHLGGMSE